MSDEQKNNNAESDDDLHLPKAITLTDKVVWIIILKRLKRFDRFLEGLTREERDTLFRRLIYGVDIACLLYAVNLFSKANKYEPFGETSNKTPTDWRKLGKDNTKDAKIGNENVRDTLNRSKPILRSQSRIVSSAWFALRRLFRK